MARCSGTVTALVYGVSQRIPPCTAQQGRDAAAQNVRPPAQGFAPHFDDVDVYVLQVEGRKRWRVAAPLPGHALPRCSSRDFVDAEVGACMLDVELAPGDLLYLPRGTIHQAESLPGAASLHLTVSADHRRSWADLLEASLQVHHALRLDKATAYTAHMHDCSMPCHYLTSA